MKRAIVLGVLAVGALRAYTQELKPVAMWTFEEESGEMVKDVSGHGHDGVIRNVALDKCRAKGIIGRAIDLGGGYIEIADGEKLNLPGPMTVSAWIKPMEGRTHMAILCKKGDVQPLGYRFSFAWHRIFFEIGDGKEKYRTSSDAWSVPSGFWRHVAATYDGKKTRLFIDAELVKEEDAAGPIAPLEQPLIIGAYVGRKDAYNFKGLLDQIKIFDHAVPPDQIFTLTDFAK